MTSHESLFQPAASITAKATTVVPQLLNQNASNSNIPFSLLRSIVFFVVAFLFIYSILLKMKLYQNVCAVKEF